MNGEIYRVGGARVEILVATVVAISICGAAISRRITASASPNNGASVAMAAAVVEHTEQKCWLLLPPFRSAQKWSCANRNTNANNKAHSFSGLCAVLIFILIVGPKCSLMSTCNGRSNALHVEVAKHARAQKPGVSSHCKYLIMRPQSRRLCCPQTDESVEKLLSRYDFICLDYVLLC